MKGANFFFVREELAAWRGGDCEFEPRGRRAGICGPSAAYAARSTLVSADSHAVKSSMPSRFEKDRRKSRPRAVPGHWEGDLRSGSGNHHIVTLVERHSRFTTLLQVPSKDTAVVLAARTRHARKLPGALRRLLTWDRGLEMAEHTNFTMATDVTVYFCDPQCPWQRGSNETTNGRFRQYFLEERTCRAIRKRIWTEWRCGQILGFQTPANRLQESVASTG